MKTKRKRQAQPESFLNPGFSSLLREAIHLINIRQTGAALEILDRALGLAASPAQRAKIATLAAKSQAALGRYDEAAAQFKSAREIAKTDQIEQTHWLPAVLGQVRALLKGQHSEEASKIARVAADEAEDREKQFHSVAGFSASQLKNIGTMRVGPRPLRLNAVLTRLATGFWEDGYAAEAKGFLYQAIESSPNGASRARQVLASILLQENQPAEAEQYARESLQMGRFQAKTIASWPILIASRAKQNKPLLDISLYRAFRKTATGSVFERSLFLIIAELRRRSDDAWKDIAAKAFDSNGLADPVIRFEIGKILIAEARLTSNHAEAFRLGGQLFSDKFLSRKESVAITKAVVEAGLLTGKLGNRVDQMRHSVEKRFGQATAAEATHGMALAAMMAKSYDLARNLLNAQCLGLEKGCDQWSKGKWALASMESALGNHAAAAKLSLDIADAAKVPPRFRLQALLNWVDSAQKAKTEIDFDHAQKRVEAIVGSIEDYRSLLDAARQLALAGSPFRQITRTIAQSAEARAIAAFQSSTNPTEATGILNHLARRQYYDLSRSSQLAAFWESLSEEKVGWLWSKDSRLWETIGLVGASYLDLGRDSEGEKFLCALLADDTVPESGRIFLLVPYGNWLREEDRIAEAWPLFERAIASSPDHRLAAHANYWFAVREFQRADREKAESYALSVRKCLAPKPGLHWEWTLDGKAALLLRRIYGNDSRVDTRLYKPDFLARIGKVLDADIARFNS